MASDHTADKTVTPERNVAAAHAAALAKERAPRVHEEPSKVGATALALGALGVVYGDIGTSPLYSLKEAFTEKSHRLAVDEINVYGVCSLAFWSLVIIISIKYLMLVMRADNKGEGGILALTALVMPKRGRTVAKAGVLVSLGCVRHRAAVRRRHHHPGDLGAQRGRGLGGGVHVVRALGDPDRDRHPHRSVRGTAARDRRRGQSLRAGDDGLVRHHRGARPVAHLRLAGDHQVGQPVLRHPASSATRA